MRNDFSSKITPRYTYIENGVEKFITINQILITGGGVINHPFSGISNQSPLGWEEVVWGASLTRSSSFALSGIDNIDIGYVRQVELIFPIMNVEDFIALQKILHERYCTVTAFYVDDMKWHTCEMAITNNERKRIYNYGTTIMGMREFKVKFVATNNDNVDVGSMRTITYKANGGIGEDIEETNEFASQVQLANNDVFSNGSKYIAYWCSTSDGTGALYLPTQKITMTNSLTLYAIWSD